MVKSKTCIDCGAECIWANAAEINKCDLSPLKDKEGDDTNV